MLFILMDIAQHKAIIPNPLFYNFSKLLIGPTEPEEAVSSSAKWAYEKIDVIIIIVRYASVQYVSPFVGIEQEYELASVRFQ